MGYARSKLVSECVHANAAKAIGMTAQILRICHIVDDTKNAIRSNPEAKPMVSQSATTIEALFSLEEKLGWLLVDTVAAGISESSLSQKQRSNAF